jgi:4-aminobutyrate aminotransferase
MSDSIASDAPAVISPVLGRYFERHWSHGDGHRLYDTDGRAYLDFANGIAVTILGHHHPRVTAAVHAQVDRLIGPTGAMGFSDPVVRLAEMLADACPDPLDTVMFLNSGSEAIEAAMKLARRVTGRPAFIAFRGGFHGRTFGATSLTSSSLNYRTGYEPLLPTVHLLPYPDAFHDFDGDEDRATAACLAAIDDLFATSAAPGSVAAMVIEPVIGEGGYVPAPAAFLRGLRHRCDANGILLVSDEVQTGYGRTGRMWGFEHAGIVPDVITVAKGIANGLPLSAIVTRRELHERWGKGAHGSTFGGNPVSCAAGVAVLETIADEGLIANAARMGAELTAGLRSLAEEDERIGDVRGPGLMIGLEFVTSRATREPDAALLDRVRQRCADGGLLLLYCGRSSNVIRFIPPLDVTGSEIDEALGILVGALAAS